MPRECAVQCATTIAPSLSGYNADNADTLSMNISSQLNKLSFTCFFLHNVPDVVLRVNVLLVPRVTCADLSAHVWSECDCT